MTQTLPAAPEYNRTGIDYRKPMPRPKVRGQVIDWHCHLLARRHAPDWFEAADHYSIDSFITMTPLDEAVPLHRDYGQRLKFIAVNDWRDQTPQWHDNYLRHIEAFYNLGSRIVKIHMAPQSMVRRNWRLDSPLARRILDEAVARKMIIMTHLGDPDTWYNSKYTDHTKYGTREEHYQMWDEALTAYAPHPWVGAHMGGNPENLHRLQYLLDKHPQLYLDSSATRWMVREISARRDEARDFIIRNADRILFGTDQVSGDDRHFDFLASRFWCHRKLWETAYVGQTPIHDPDVSEEQQPVLRGLALPDNVLQKLYHDNAVKLLSKVGMTM